MEQDPLEYLPENKWDDLQDAFKSDWPRSVAGFNTLKTYRKWIEEDFDKDIKVYCPFGDIWNGMVAVIDKGPPHRCEMVIQCPGDTTKLEEAINKTKLIDWSRYPTLIPFAPSHVFEIIQRTMKKKCENADQIAVFTDSFIWNREIPLSEDISEMNHIQEPLELLPVHKWRDLLEAFKSDWPRSISGYSILGTQQRWIEKGFDYGFTVYCPYGDVWNGMVAVNEKDIFYEIVIQCPRNDTRKLEEAIKITKVIDWKKDIIIPFAPNHIIKCIKNIVEEVNVDIELILPSESFILNKNTQPFDISLPIEITFGNLSLEHANLVDSKWPHRYPGSLWYIQLLINTKSGFGLFINRDLISWVFINEAGTLGQMFTLEDHRRKGYAEMLLKLICNNYFKERKDAFAFCVKGNVGACKLYRKVGFENYDCGVSWCYLKSEIK